MPITPGPALPQVPGQTDFVTQLLQMLGGQGQQGQQNLLGATQQPAAPSNAQQAPVPYTPPGQPQQMGAQQDPMAQMLWLQQLLRLLGQGQGAGAQAPGGMPTAMGGQ